MKKRGAYDIVTMNMVILIGLLIVFSAFFPNTLRMVLGIRDTTYFEKTFLVRDMAVTLNTLYSSPGNVIAAYDKDTLWFSYEFDKGNVLAYDTNPEEKIMYPIVHTEFMKFDRKKLEAEFLDEPKTEENLRRKVKPIFAKINDEIIINEQITRSINELKCEDLQVGEGKILIDAGHGGGDEGIVANNKKEKDITGPIGFSIHQKLSTEAFFTRGNIGGSVQDQTRKIGYNTKEKTTEEVNKNNIEIIISIHTGGVDDLSNNVKSFYSLDSNDESQQKSKKLACEIINELARNKDLDITGTSVVGIYPEDYAGGHILVQDKIAILLELGNLKNTKSADILTQSNTIGNLIKKGIENAK